MIIQKSYRDKGFKSHLGVNEPKVSIVIVNWNGQEYLKKCLSSAYAQTYRDFNIVFVDNGSEDGSVEFVAENFPEAEIIKNNENVGFADGNNIGIKKSFEDIDVKYIATLNNDTIVEPSWLRELVSAAEKDRIIGSCQSKMLRYYDRSIIDSTGIKLLANGTVSDRGAGEKDDGQYDKLEEVFGACAGAALYRREMLNESGLFPSHYFASFEDVDLAWRARYAGWKCVYVPSAVVYHFRFATQKKMLDEKQTFSVQKIQNRFSYQMKYLPFGCLLKSAPRLTKLYFKSIRMAIKNGHSDLRKAIGLLPTVLIERHKYHRDNKLDEIGIYEWLKKK
ncbi:MAG TPA: glycosyltransferase family 2 protein [Sedimentisphaerales bacterium]|nr:glycosyltransferase family 2 protein [Sedimentisphaerales bacterium]